MSERDRMITGLPSPSPALPRTSTVAKAPLRSVRPRRGWMTSLSGVRGPGLVGGRYRRSSARTVHHLHDHLAAADLVCARRRSDPARPCQRYLCRLPPKVPASRTGRLVRGPTVRTVDPPRPRAGQVLLGWWAEYATGRTPAPSWPSWRHLHPDPATNRQTRETSPTTPSAYKPGYTRAAPGRVSRPVQQQLLRPPLDEIRVGMRFARIDDRVRTAVRRPGDHRSADEASTTGRATRSSCTWDRSPAPP